MELNWTTFVLEMVNFLVLVWLLKRFFYQPVQDMIAQRRQSIEHQLQDSKTIETQANKLREQYENRLSDWDKERQSARFELQQEIEKERRQLHMELQQSLKAERKKSEVLIARQAEEQQRQSEAKALELGARFATRLLDKMASKNLQETLIELLVEELQELPPEKREAILAQKENGRPEAVQVLSAYPLGESEQVELQKCLDGIMSSPLTYEYSMDSNLLAGVRITFGPWIIHANLHDELKIFAAIAHEH